MISENIENLKSQITEILEAQNKSLQDIIFLAVTKTHSVLQIEEALRSGVEFIAENKVQEAEQKIPNLSVSYKEFHFIGHLQSNKINKLMALKPTLIHSIDKFSTAKKLNDYCGENGYVQPILIQVNTSSEESKFGIKPEETFNFIRQFEPLENLRIEGLMTIGKLTDDPTEIRTCFRMLKKLFDDVRKLHLPFLNMKHLSMGMTDDFPIALEEGATIIRIGSAIFGRRI